MKYKLKNLIPLLFVAAIAFSCNEEAETTEEKIEIERMDSTTKTVEKNTDELEEQTEKVEDALEKLENQFDSTNN